jgi:hypothetical protein
LPPIRSFPLEAQEADTHVATKGRSKVPPHVITKPNRMREFKHIPAKLQKNANPRTNNKCNSRTSLLILYLHIHILQECQYAPLAITLDLQHYLCNTNWPTFIFEQNAQPTTFDPNEQRENDNIQKPPKLLEDDNPS